VSVPRRIEIPRAGTASVVDRRGRVYFGFVVFDGNSITLDGHRRERWHTADGPAETHYAVSKTWPVGQVDHIDWVETATRAAA
jgi:hypothetical protein